MRNNALHFYRQAIDAERIFEIVRELHQTTRQQTPPAPDLILSSNAMSQLIKIEGTDGWIHSDSSGCAVTAQKDPTTGMISVYLEGSDRAQAVAFAHLSRVSDYIEPAENEQWLETAKHFPSYDDINMFPQPPIWTIRSFKLYISCLVQQRPRRSAKRYLHSGQSTHIDATARLIHNAFYDRESSPFASVRAWRLALRFSRVHARAELFEAVWKSGLVLGLQPDISCYNEALGACLLLKKAYMFFDLVAGMKQASVKVNEQTWQLVLSYTESQGLRLRILSYLKSSGIIAAAGSVEPIVHAMVKHDFRPYMDRPNGFKRFDTALGHYLGREWLTTDVLARMLRICRVRFRDAGADMASQILCYLQEHDRLALLDRACFAQLVHVTAKTHNLADALVLLRSKSLQDDPDLQQQILYLIFRMAWRKQKLNICHLLWYQAALSGRMLRAMQYLVKNTLRWSVRESNEQEGASWSSKAAKLIIGINASSRGLHNILPQCFPAGTEDSAMGPLLNDDGLKDRHQLLQLVHLILERDLHAWRFYKKLPFNMFRRLLNEAEELDVKWEKEDLVSASTIQTLLQSRLSIETHARKQILTARKLSSNASLPNRPFLVNGHALSYDTLDIAEDVPNIEEEYTSDIEQPLRTLLNDETAIIASDSPARVSNNMKVPVQAESVEDYRFRAFA